MKFDQGRRMYRPVHSLPANQKTNASICYVRQDSVSSQIKKSAARIFYHYLILIVTLQYTQQFPIYRAAKQRDSPYQPTECKKCAVREHNLCDS
jgi:hypothetical protein